MRRAKQSKFLVFFLYVFHPVTAHTRGLCWCYTLYLCIPKSRRKSFLWTLPPLMLFAVWRLTASFLIPLNMTSDVLTRLQIKLWKNLRKKSFSFSFFLFLLNKRGLPIITSLWESTNFNMANWSGETLKLWKGSCWWPWWFACSASVSFRLHHAAC